MSGSGAPADAARRAAELRAALRRHDRLYFVENKPEISDPAYDALVRELRGIEAQYPELLTPDSPTQRVGEQPLAGFAHVRHALPMMSVDNTYSAEELREFDARVRKILEDEPYRYLVDPKIDGVAVSLRYEAGRFVLGATRGDGAMGDDITANLRTVRSIPLTLTGEGWPALLEIRGEVYWPRPAFDKTNDERVKDGEEPFKNPRNATAGTLKQLDPRVTARRGLAFICHGFGVLEPMPMVATTSELYGQFRAWGVPLNPHLRPCATIDEVVQHVRAWDEQRHRLDYETDGLVIKIDSLEQRARLGTTSKAPRWCIAYKYAAEQARTTVVDVVFQVGKLGTITPVANLAPVLLAGTTVKRASLHNFDQVRRLALHVGDTVTVEKAGEIIPQVVAVHAELRPADAQAVAPPTECPECHGPVQQDEGGVYLRCLNPECPAQMVERLRFFCGRNQMDIDGLGEVLVERLVAEGLVKTYADLFRLVDQRERVEGLVFEQQRESDGVTKTIQVEFGKVRTDKLFAGLAAAKQRPLARLLAALNIRHVGTTTAELLADFAAVRAAQLGIENHLDALAAADVEALQEVEGVGPEVAASVRAFFASEPGQHVISELKQVGVNTQQPHTAPAADTPIKGKTFVVTGTLVKYTRSEIETLIKRLGGKVSSSVSKKTSYVVAGAEAGSKLEKAQTLGVTVLDEEGFDVLLGGGR